MPTPPALVIGHSPSGISRRRRGGFALLITITLLAFLVLLLVSLASLTRVETQVANNGQQASQARQNALMALNIALGQLQKYAGPDQRVTARADVNSALANTTTQSGRWLGVYGRAVEAADTATRDLYSDIPSKIQTDIDKNSDDNGNQAVLLNWLVSGNENTAFNPGSMVDANGQIQRNLAPASFDFAQTDAVALGGATALSTNVTVKAKPARLLVGPGSASAAADYVAAPLVAVSAVAPGAGSSPVTVGNYAWWVGDENAKALVNLPAAATASDKALAFVASRRAAIELVDGVNPVGSTPAFSTSQLIGPAYQPSNANLPNIVAANQLPLLTPGSSAALATATKHRFHDLTGYSYSVLSDTYAGGLKKDLSALLAPLSATGLTAPADTDFLFPPEPDSPSSPTNSFGLPTWGVLRSFAKTRAPATGGLSPEAPKMATVSGLPVPVATSPGIGPVMTYATLGFQYAAPQGDVANAPIQLAVFPVVVLWNPYTVDIAPSRYEFGLRRAYDALIQLQGRPAGATDSTHPWSSRVLETRDLGKAGSTSSSAANAYFRFIIDNATGIPAGQSLVFTLQTAGQPYSAADPTNMLSADSYNPLGHVLIPSSLTITTPGQIYRVGVNGRGDDTTTPRKTLFGYAVRNNMGGPDGGWHEAYLGTVGAPVPGGSRPFTGTTTFTSQQFYQQLSVTNAPYTGSSPYGATAGGYPVSTVNTGLIQNEGSLSIVTAPTFRIPIRALFSRPERTEYSSRWIAQSNPRALVVGGFPTGSQNGTPDLYTGRPPESGSWPYGLRVQGTRAASGSSLLDTTLVDTTLFEFRPASQPLMAIGQLQHANLSWQVAYPSYAIGNSLGGSKFSATTADVVFRTTGGSIANDPAKLTTGYYDLSWLANRALWDRYFVSTVPHTGTGAEGESELTDVPPVLPNPRHLKLETASEPKLRDVAQAAAHLMITGGFNINSTSEQAWRAVLGGMNQLNYDPTGSNTGGSASSDAVISRFSKPTTNGAANGWQGYRKLTAEQIAELAKNIVTQIRKRGPFVSMADFVNRRLIQNEDFPQADDTRLKGPLQAALDATISGTNAVNTNAAPFDTLVVNSYNVAPTNPFQTGAAVSGSPSGAATRSLPVSTTAAFSPQYVTQADILSAIGSGLSARSDTFTIRTYGESNNPALQSGDAGYITGRAWCEAVVQRLPNYVDSTTDPDAHLSPSASLNKNMGRRFKIVSFRWLTSNDI